MPDPVAMTPVDRFPNGHQREERARVRVFGDGVLATAVAGAVRQATTERPAHLVSSVCDSWTTEWEQSRQWCRDHAVPWLPVRAELGVVVIGPLERPGIPGCVRCAEARRNRARADPDGTLAVWHAHREALAASTSSLLTTLAANTVAELIAAEAALLAPGTEPRTTGAVLLLDLHTLEVSRHRFLPDPCCADCAPPSENSPSGIDLRPRPKQDRDSYRLRPDLDPEELRSCYVDTEAGLIRELRYGTSAGLALVQAPMRLRGTHRAKRTESGYGRTRDFRTSETVAICEALERYGGLQQGGSVEVLRASYREVAGRAVDVGSLGLHPPESYRQPGFRCQPFDPDRPYNWVTGYSFDRDGPVLIPERLAYYGIGERDAHDPLFVLDSSNGGATGSCPEEAILYGILEVVERDAFLMSWYARMPVPAIDPASASDPTIPLLAEQIKQEHGYRVSLFDTTLEHGIPSVWAMAVRMDDDRSRPHVCCSAGAHLDPKRAVVSALAELGPILHSLISVFPDNTERVEQMVQDSAQVREMTDHGMLYGDSRVFDRFDFLAAARTGVPVEEAFGNGWPRIAGDDLTGDLLAVVNRIRGAGMDVIAVDQTTPEHRSAGLCCVKTFVPGMLPMSFGHEYRRIHGISRLHDVPAHLGYAERPLTGSDINPYPHPFP